MPLTCISEHCDRRRSSSARGGRPQWAVRRARGEPIRCRRAVCTSGSTVPDGTGASYVRDGACVTYDATRYCPGRANLVARNEATGMPARIPEELCASRAPWVRLIAQMPTGAASIPTVLGAYRARRGRKRRDGKRRQVTKTHRTLGAFMGHHPPPRQPKRRQRGDSKQRLCHRRSSDQASKPGATISIMRAGLTTPCSCIHSSDSAIRTSPSLPPTRAPSRHRAATQWNAMSLSTAAAIA